jgi:hypothetical protein
METLPQATATVSVLDLLEEAFEGPRDPRSTWFVSNAPDSGIFGTLAALSPQDASRAPGPGRRSAAAHTSHLAFSLRVSAAVVRGDHPTVNWAESWAVSSVDERGWSGLRSSLRADYDAVRAELAERTEWDGKALTAAMAMIAHAAYHLGALRQIAQPVAHDPHP